MAEITRGKHSGKQATIHQFANDWMSVDIVDGPQGVIVAPTSVRLDTAEANEVREHVGTGQFWALWQLNDDGTFVRASEVTRG